MEEQLEHFHVIEGIDGSGKTTLGHLLEKKFPHVRIGHEPTSTSQSGALIHGILKKKITATPEEILDLFIENRKENQRWIKNQLQKGFTVILDRYILSTFAYQGNDFSFDELYEKNKIFLKPKNIVFLSISPETSLQRRFAELKPGQALDFYENLEYQKKTQLKYDQAIDFLKNKNYPISIIDANQTIQKIFEECVSIMNLKD